jgi:hypothetical protein
LGSVAEVADDLAVRDIAVHAGDVAVVVHDDDADDVLGFPTSRR